MGVFEFTLCLLLAGVGLTLLAERLSIPWPALLALGGAALAFVPGVPQAALDPRLALALFVAPVLLDAAFDASLRDLRDNVLPVGGLALVAVALTVAAVAVAARQLDPAMPWAAAVALGAIVAPPDATAATAVLRQVRLPHRVQVILEGESLLNDASALLIYRVAVGAAGAGLTHWAGLLLLGAAIGGVALGILLARAYLALTGPVRGAGPAWIVLQFLTTFGVWLLADALQLSAVLTMVAYAATLARFAPVLSRARERRATYAVWEVVVYVSSVLAFILTGMQLRTILARLDGQAAAYAGFALATLGVVVAVRFAWVMSYNAVVRWKNRRFGPVTRRPMTLPTVQGAIAISWCGMRGIVTLAAALALPTGFPERDLIVFTAFCVVLGTLVVQGATLRPLIVRLRMPADDSVAEEAEAARQETARAALAALDGRLDEDAGRVLALEYQARLDGRADDGTSLAALRREALAAERRRLTALRQEGRIGDDAFHLIEEELDWAEAERRG